MLALPTSETDVAFARHHRHVSSLETEEVHATRDLLLGRLSKLLPGQLEELFLRAAIPPEYLPGQTASPIERAVAAVRYIEQQGRLEHVADLLDVAAELPREPRRSPTPQPVYQNAEIRALSERIEHARARKRILS